MTKSTRIVSGLYEVKIHGRTFHVEDEYQARGDGNGRNQWNLFEVDAEGKREYWQTFYTKRQVLEALEGEI